MGRTDFHRPDNPLWTRLCKVALLLALVILTYYSLIPSDSIGVSASDKVLHFIAYGLIAGLYAASYPTLRLRWVFIISSVLGAGLEIAQHLAGTGRSASVTDQLANMGGAGLAIALWCGLVWLLNRFGRAGPA